MTRATVLAIGTELTQGQITNRNAVWISQRLTDLGIEVIAHITVPDERGRMRTALEQAALSSELIIVTGGLGPTTDDFTREVIAEWLGSPLEFQESAWKKIVNRLTERGIDVAQSNRAQCFFPVGVEVLENSEGTADGFRFTREDAEARAAEVFVIPGPPREGQYLWDRYIRAWLAKRFPAAEARDLETWHCLGISESSLGEIVEAAVAGFGATTGYRASVPYVEVKLWIPRELEEKRRGALIQRLESALKPYAVARNSEDLAERFADELQARTGNAPIFLYDLGTAGHLASRTIALLRSEAGRELRGRVEISARFPVSGSETSKSEVESKPQVVGWKFYSDADGRVMVMGPPGARTRELPNPYPSPAMAERLGGYRAEMSLKAWREMLAELKGAGV